MPRKKINDPDNKIPDTGPGKKIIMLRSLILKVKCLVLLVQLQLALLMLKIRYPAFLI